MFWHHSGSGLSCQCFLPYGIHSLLLLLPLFVFRSKEACLTSHACCLEPERKGWAWPPTSLRPGTGDSNGISIIYLCPSNRSGGVVDFSVDRPSEPVHPLDERQDQFPTAVASTSWPIRLTSPHDQNRILMYPWCRWLHHLPFLRSLHADIYKLDDRLWNSTRQKKRETNKRKSTIYIYNTPVGKLKFRFLFPSEMNITAFSIPSSLHNMYPRVEKYRNLWMDNAWTDHGGTKQVFRYRIARYRLKTIKYHKR